MLKKQILVGLLAVSFVLSPVFASADAVSDLQAQIQSLLATIASLQAKLEAVNRSSSGGFCFTFNRYLAVGFPMRETEADSLKKVLVNEGVWDATNDIGVFDDDVASGVIDFQAKYGIKKTGTVGPLTRAKLNALYGCGVPRSNPPIPPFPLPPTLPIPTNPLPPVSPISVSSPTATITGAPTLELTYDSNNSEALLRATFNVSVTAGNSNLSLFINDANASFIDQNQKGGGSSLNSWRVNVSANADKNTDSYGRNYITIPAGRTTNLTVVLTANPKQMFAGSYYGILYNLYTLGSDINPSVINLPVYQAQTNSKTIIGEVSPYVTSAKMSDRDRPGVLVIQGVRFNPTNNIVTIGTTELTGIASTNNGTQIATDKVLPSGSQGVFVTNPDLGREGGKSNVFWVNIGGGQTGQPSITVLSPNGGELWNQNTEQTVRWTYIGLNSNDIISIGFVSPDGAVCWNGTSPVYHGQFNTIPNSAGCSNNISKNLRSGGQYKVKLAVSEGPNSIGRGVADESDSYFTITAAQIDPIPSTLTASILNTSADHAGTGNNFSPGSGDDWNFSATLSLSDTKSIKSITLDHNTNGEGWSTSIGTNNKWGKGLYPLVVDYKGRQIDYGYDAPFLETSFGAGTHTFTLYGQKSSSQFTGGTITFAFIDGTNASAIIAPPTLITPLVPVSKPLVCGNVGDVNRDGLISQADSDATAQIVAGSFTPSAVQQVSADVNGDGQVNASDITILNRFISGLETTFARCSGANLSSLSISAPADQPPATLLPNNASKIPLVKFTLKAGDANVTVNSIAVQKSGTAPDSIFSGLMLLDENNNQIGGVGILNSNHQSIVGSLFVVNAGSSRTLTIAGNIGNTSGYAGSVATLQIVVVFTGSTVSGVLPITGNPQTVNASLQTGTATASVSVYDPGSAQTIAAGNTGYRFAGVKITSGSLEALRLSSIRWKLEGSVSPDDLSSVSTVVDGVVYPSGRSLDGKYYISSFGSGITIDKGFSKDIYVKGDILQSAAGKTVKFNIESATDVSLAGQLYSFGITPSANLVNPTDNYSEFSNGKNWFDGSLITVSGSVSVVQPSITVLSPNGGEVYKLGDTMQIRWNSSRLNSGQIAIVPYRFDDNLNYGKGVTSLQPIVVPNTGSYSWLIPSGSVVNTVLPCPSGNGCSTAGTMFKIAIIYTDVISGTTDQIVAAGAGDYSDNFFTITSPTTTYHPADTNRDGRIVSREVTAYGAQYGDTLDSRSAGEIWKRGELYSWDSNARAWKDAVGVLVSDVPSVTVSTPTHGEVWTSGMTKTIQWSAPNYTGLIGIALQNSSGGWTLANNITNWGSYTATLPYSFQQGPDYYIRVSEMNAQGSMTASGVSGNFSIVAPVPPPTIDSVSVTDSTGAPTTVLTKGSTYTIKWNEHNTTKPINVYLIGLPRGYWEILGSVLVTVQPSATGNANGTATWTVPTSLVTDTGAGKYQIYVEQTGNATAGAAGGYYVSFVAPTTLNTLTTSQMASVLESVRATLEGIRASLGN